MATLFGMQLQPSDEASTIAAEASLVPGPNRFEARLIGPDGPVGVAGPIVVTRLQPPTVASLDVPTESEEGAITVKATVHSAKDLEPESVRVTVNGVAVNATAAVEKTGADGVWNVTVADVPLARPANEISLLIANADGQARKAGVARVSRVSPAPKPVFVELVGLSQQMTLSVREVTTTIVLRAAVPISRAKLELNGHSEDLTLPPASQPGEYRIQKSLSLTPGMNTVQVTATARDGGIGQGEARVAVIERPVTIEVDRLVSTDGSELVPVCARRWIGRPQRTCSDRSGDAAWTHHLVSSIREACQRLRLSAFVGERLSAVEPAYLRRR